MRRTTVKRTCSEQGHRSQRLRSLKPPMTKSSIESAIDLYPEDEEALATYVQALYGGDLPAAEFIAANPTSWKRFKEASVSACVALTKVDGGYLGAAGVSNGWLESGAQSKRAMESQPKECQFLEDCQEALWALVSSYSSMGPWKKKGLLSRLLTGRDHRVLPPPTNDSATFYSSWKHAPEGGEHIELTPVYDFFSAMDDELKGAYVQLLRPVAAMARLLELNGDYGGTGAFGSLVSKELDRLS